MTAPTAASDPIMDRITTAVTAHRAGSGGDPRANLIALWREVTPTGDPFHRCVLAHYLADMFDTDPAQALCWDVRALDAADALSDARAQQHAASLQVAAFYPSLHLNLADNLRRLGSFDTAADHVAQARSRAVALEDLGPEHADYVAMMRTILDELDSLVRTRSSERRASTPG